MKILRITPGENNKDWQAFYEKGFIGTYAHPDVDYSGINSIDEFAVLHKFKDRSVAAKIINLKRAPLGTIITVGNSSKKHIGVGKIKGEYRYLPRTKRPEGLEGYPHLLIHA